MSWNRLSENEQDVTILTWFEILSDAGVPVERYSDCYRSAQQRENERRAQGKDRQTVTPNDLAVEWSKIKDLHYELDKSRLLAENAAGTCLRCYGTGKEEMEGGTVREGCKHLPIEKDEAERRQQAAIERGAQMMKEAMKRIGNPKPVQRGSKFVDILMECSYCHRRAHNDGVMWKDGDECGALLDPDKDEICRGQLFERKRVGSPF